MRSRMEAPPLSSSATASWASASTLSWLLSARWAHGFPTRSHSPDTLPVSSTLLSGTWPDAHQLTAMGMWLTRTNDSFATGWNYFFKYVIVLPNNLTVTGVLIQYWLPNVNVSVWIVVFGIAIIALNVCLPPKSRFSRSSLHYSLLISSYSSFTSDSSVRLSSGCLCSRPSSSACSF